MTLLNKSNLTIESNIFEKYFKILRIHNKFFQNQRNLQWNALFKPSIPISTSYFQSYQYFLILKKDFKTIQILLNKEGVPHECIEAQKIETIVMLRLLWNGMLHTNLTSPCFTANKFLYTDLTNTAFSDTCKFYDEQIPRQMVFEIKINEDTTISLIQHTFTKWIEASKDILQNRYKPVTLYRFSLCLDTLETSIFPVELSTLNEVSNDVYAYGIIIPNDRMKEMPALNLNKTKNGKHRIDFSRLSLFMKLIKDFNALYNPYGVCLELTELDKCFHLCSFNNTIGSKKANINNLYKAILASLKKSIKNDPICLIFPSNSKLTTSRKFEWKEGINSLLKNLDMQNEICIAEVPQKDSLNIIFLDTLSSEYNEQEGQEYICQHIIDQRGIKFQKIASYTVLEKCLFELGIKKDIFIKKMNLFKYYFEQQNSIKIADQIKKLTVFKQYKNKKANQWIQMTLSFPSLDLEFISLNSIDCIDQKIYRSFLMQNIPILDTSDAIYIALNNGEYTSVIEDTKLIALNPLEELKNHLQKVENHEITKQISVRIGKNIHLIDSLVDIQTLLSNNTNDPCLYYYSGLISNGMNSKIQNFCRIRAIRSIEPNTIWSVILPFLYCNGITSKDRYSALPIFMKYMDEYARIFEFKERVK